MRIRTGHRPQDWTPNDPGARAAPVFGFDHGGYVVEGGAFVQGDAGRVDKQRKVNREKARRKAAQS